MSSGILKVKGNKIVDNDGNEVLLRGAAIGGWMNMENFITGYPGHESQHRTAMKKVLGPEKYEFFFDRWLEYFFTEADAKFFAGLGLNCIRIPFNYRHLEDDMNPRVLKESGFKHLDRVVDLHLEAKMVTGIQITSPATLRSGTTRITRTEQYGYGNRLRLDTGLTRGSPGIILLTNRATPSMLDSLHFTRGSRRLSVPLTQTIFYG
ncbi:unnamed protein product [Aspergillus oryzae RIB40]|uniref:DNA, SC005 n=2 Tax=Aspergillus oryzae TaxID=5062 RepID=Q2USH7_ASPOR|nr:unnamed protein product [Aspergillus oryzae RIB40]EIT77528.1 hypothetical protein Ao3042_06256 [Aspergillus oryzae 3.042]KDE76810.1 hypothetical protein AO1008_02750 [Aspergillus oryzae 100-8]BAE55488.1 unnamed protein product [Aspergillus oryzae RIB40]|eukprot:EIT77528.1 hypothetical protein Ao3042_06256 [Aspergillus oryzae 3.042]